MEGRALRVGRVERRDHLSPRPLVVSLFLPSSRECLHSLTYAETSDYTPGGLHVVECFHCGARWRRWLDLRRMREACIARWSRSLSGIESPWNPSERVDEEL